jgi:hypothetical protein
MSYSHLQLSKNPYQAVMEFMEINLKISGFRLVVMLDGFDAYAATEDAPERARLIEEMRGLASEFFAGKLSFVLTASPFGEKPETDADGVFHVDIMDGEDAAALVKNPAGCEFGFTDEAVTLILQAAGGHPYLVQCLCLALVDDKNGRKADGDIDGDDVRRVIHPQPSAVTEYFEEFWERDIDAAARKTLTQAALDRPEPDAKPGGEPDAVGKNPATAAFLQETENGPRFRSSLFKDWITTRVKETGGGGGAG